jgi:hypothetical protein
MVGCAPAVRQSSLGRRIWGLVPAKFGRNVLNFNGLDIVSGISMPTIRLFIVGSFSCSAPVAQLDRVPGYEPGGRGFESLRARQ